MCVGVAGDAEQGGSAAAEWRSMDGALCEGHRSAGNGRLTQLLITELTPPPSGFGPDYIM